MPTVTETIKQEAHRLGFDSVGVAKIQDKPDSSRRGQKTIDSEETLQGQLYSRLLEWLSRGYQGTMEWMTRNPERRSDPQVVLPECRSILCLGKNYFADDLPEEGRGIGRIARYAWGNDYHRHFKGPLKQLEKFIQTLVPGTQTRSYADTGPVMEKAWAQEAGLGWIGKHSNLVSPEFGSWLLLGEILTTADLEPDDPGTDLCGSCSLCLQACPTGAITEPYVVDAEKCISYLTIEFRGQAEDIPGERRAKMGNHIFGCDDCLDICPYNVNAQINTEPAFQPSPLTLGPQLMTLSNMSEHTFHSTFQHSPIRRAKHSGLLRNVRIAQQNTNPRTAISTPQS